MVKVDLKKCIGCGTCKSDCAVANIVVKDRKAVHGKWCMECGQCTAVCPQRAVTFLGDYDPSEINEYDPKQFEIEPERLLNFVKFRRSVRQYTDEPVSDAGTVSVSGFPIHLGQLVSGLSEKPEGFIIPWSTQCTSNCQPEMQ